MKKITKKLLIVLLVLTAIAITVVVSVAIFVNTAPQMGAPPSGNHLERISRSPHYQQGQFQNIQPEKSTEFSIGRGLAIMWEIITAEGTVPDQPLPTRFAQENTLLVDSLARLTWYGHSTFLLEMEGKRILIDPMLGPHAAPVSFFGKRFPYEQPITLDDLTAIDLVILSHDHYDHLDYYSICRLKDEVAHFVAPLGVGAHLRHWGVEESKITELDWWDQTQKNQLTLVATPARHFSGRNLNDSKKTLWASWVIRGTYTNIYFSGDGGYGAHFREIGKKYGPFDFAMIECGQYNLRWADIHMMPEQSLQAAIDIQTSLMMPIHWSAFSLSLHPWREPAERLAKAAEGSKMRVLYPYIGQAFVIGRDFPEDQWFLDF